MNCSNTKAFSIPCGHFTKDFGGNVEGEPLVTLKIVKEGTKYTHPIDGVDGASIRISGDLDKLLAVGGNYTATIHHPVTGAQLTFVDSIGDKADEVQFTVSSGGGSGVYWFFYE